MPSKIILVKAVFYGLVASLFLLVFYFLVLTFISGWFFTKEQFKDFWYYVVSLAVGFGVQVALFVYLKKAVHQNKGSGKILAVSGTTSTAAMISCCAHYLTTVAPVLGIAGAVSLIAQYQLQLFWVGLAFNMVGIIFISHKLFKFHKINV